MDLKAINDYLGQVNHITTLLASVITLSAVVVALYLGSSFHENRKQLKLERRKFKRRFPDFYECLMLIYKDFKSSHRSENWNIKDAARANLYTPNFLKHSYRVFDNNVIKHSEEIDYLKYLKKRGMIYSFHYSTFTNQELEFSCYEYVITPSIKSWSRIETQYKNSQQGKAEYKLGKLLYDSLHLKNPSRRSFLSVIFPSMKNHH